ncbi:MAG: RNase adaptor protein RapZ, partial [Actinobacteria bacterium]|nr:RNase adaptor protein RapZ [Actinomycetota bacterium]
MALVVGRAGGGAVQELADSLELLRKGGDRVRVLFLEASPEVLVRRFEGTRRRHPLEGEGVVDSITQER